MPISGSEKRGTSVFNCRFSAKAEHIPIKKRRFFWRSPSPPPPPLISSEPTKGSASLAKRHDALDKISPVQSTFFDISLSKDIDNSSSTHDENSKTANKSFGEDEDFSGISILAAAACSSSLGRESVYAEDGAGVLESSAQGQALEVSGITEALSSSRGLLKEDLVNSSEMSTGGTSYCVSTEPVRELASISTTVNSPQKVTSKGVSLKVDSLILSGDVSCSKDEETVGIQKTCSQDDRLHWDLNVVMDAWEHPFESSKGHNDVPHAMSQDARKPNHHDSAECLEGHDFPDKLCNRSLEENKVNHTIGFCHDVTQPIGFDEKSLLSDYNRNLDVVKSSGEDSKSMCYNTTIKSTAELVIANPAIHPDASGTVNEDDDGVSVHSLKSNDDGHLKGGATLGGLNLSAGGSYSVLEDLSSACASSVMQPSLTVSSCPDIPRQSMPNLAVLRNMRTCLELQYNVNAVMVNDDIKTSKPLERAHVTSDGNCLPHSSGHVEVPNSTSTRCELAVGLDTELQCDDSIQGGNLACGNDTIVNVSEMNLLSEGTCDSISHDTSEANLDKSFNFSGNIVAAKSLNWKNSADVYVCPISSAGNDAMVEPPGDFDSQYEDGEVRDPNEHPWDGYEGLDGEAERMDYELDGTEACTPIDYYVSESGYVEDRENCGPGVAAVIASGVGNFDHGFGGEPTKLIGDNVSNEQDKQVMLNYASEEKMEASGSKELLEKRSTSSDMDIALSDDNGGKERSGSHPEPNVESKPFRRRVQSRIGGPVAHDASSQEERLNKMDFRYEESSSMRHFERPRYSFQNQGRGQRDSYRGGFRGNYRGGFRHHYSPIVPRHTKTDDDATVVRDDVGYASVQDGGSYTHQLHPRSRSGADEDEYNGLHSRYKPNGAFSPGRPSTFRGRGRGRGRYNGPSRDESFQSSLNYRRPLSCRQRSFSPFGGRGHSNAQNSRGKSPSQSRSRSPIIWNSTRGRPRGGSGRGTFVRQRSRSPNFRSELRMQRLRSAHHQPDFGHDDSVGFRPVPRSRGSPPHGRWTSAGKEEMGHFREFGCKQGPSGLERSPVRIGMRGDRASGDLKPEGYYRTSEDAACRGPRYEENFEGRRKYNAPLRPARRSYDDGMTGRFNQANDDSFSSAKDIRGREASDFQGRDRGMDNRISDLPRRFRGEQHSFTCERDGKFNSTSKQFGVDNMMDSSRNLKSEEHYQASRGGRFSDANGLNRVRRYDNFEDRRRHYDPPNLMKRSDTEGSEKRSNHKLDENFQDNSDFCGRGMRSFNGRVNGLSTRLREDKDSLVCGQENKLEDNPQ